MEDGVAGMESTGSTDLFFDDYRPNWKFSLRNRMHERFLRIMGQQPQIIQGRRVLDLGARDGRWTWAALKCGATHVTGVEGRASSAALSEKRLSAMHRSKYEMRIGDVFAVLPQMHAEGLRFDTVLCLGLYYHVYDHYSLLKLMHAMEPSVIVIDSMLTDCAWPLSRVHFDRTFSPNNAIADFTGQQYSPVGNPSTGLLRGMAATLGYAVDFKDWSAPRTPDGVADYLERRRFTAILAKPGSEIYPITGAVSLEQVIRRIKNRETRILGVLERDPAIRYPAVNAASVDESDEEDSS